MKMVSMTAFASIFLSSGDCSNAAKSTKTCDKLPLEPICLPRRTVLRILSLAASGVLLGPETPTNAFAEAMDPRKGLAWTRAALDECDDLIGSAKWDKIRTILATDPVVHAKDFVRDLAAQVDDDRRVPALGMREDLMSALKLLDGAVYSNVFIGEDREILGTKVDFNTPRIYLQDAKSVLDDLIELASSS